MEKMDQMKKLDRELEQPADFTSPEELYQDLMSYFHYELPVEEEQMLKDNAIDKLREQDRSGRDLGEIEGFDTLARRVRVPTFQ